MHFSLYCLAVDFIADHSMISDHYSTMSYS